jgi:hypothetical protein
MVSRSASLTMFRTVLSNVETQTNKVSASNHAPRMLSHPRDKIYVVNFGAHGGNRTHGLSFTKALLCQLSYMGNTI